jgi:hypothetical protein
LPVAVNCWLVLTGIEEAAGEITIEVKFAAAALTVNVAVELKEPDCAVIVTDPDPEPVAMPVLLMLAMLESDEPHCAEPVTSFVVPSDMCTVALNCCVPPTPMDTVAGET